MKLKSRILWEVSLAWNVTRGTIMLVVGIVNILTWIVCPRFVLIVY